MDTKTAQNHRRRPALKLWMGEQLISLLTRLKINTKEDIRGLYESNYLNLRVHLEMRASDLLRSPKSSKDSFRQVIVVEKVRTGTRF